MIAKLAEHGDSQVFAFPKPQLGKDSLEFSFSGLKTAVLRAAQKTAGRDFRTPSHELAALLTNQQRYDIAASFQRTMVNILAGRVRAAYERYSPASIIVAGGVAANQALRVELASSVPIPILYPPLELCTDNAAMIASLGYFRRHWANKPPTVLPPNPILSM